MTCDVVKKCKYSTYDEPNFKKHIAICAEISVKQTKCVQQSYGDNSSTIRKMIEELILPIDALYYRNYMVCTYDIETIEEKKLNCVPNRGTATDARLLLLSMAVGSNLPNYKPKCWARNSSDPAQEKVIIKKFVSSVF